MKKRDDEIGLIDLDETGTISIPKIEEDADASYVDEERAGSVVFQGEVSVETMMLTELAGELERRLPTEDFDTIQIRDIGEFEDEDTFEENEAYGDEPDYDAEDEPDIIEDDELAEDVDSVEGDELAETGEAHSDAYEDDGFPEDEYAEDEADAPGDSFEGECAEDEADAPGNSFDEAYAEDESDEADGDAEAPDYDAEAEPVDADDESSDDADALPGLAEEDLLKTSRLRPLEKREREPKARGGGRGAAGRRRGKQGRMNPRIWIVAAAALLLVLGATAALALGVRRSRTHQVNDAQMAALGARIQSIGIAGESGLVAVADARLAAQIALETEAGEDTEAATDSVIQVDVSFTSVEQDLKIKFANHETTRLISGVEFTVTLTDAKGTQASYTDSDADGILYEKGLAGGDYTVTVVPVEGYEIAPLPATVNVRDKIVYQQIDVADEIKTEAEVNVAIEDTGGNNAEAEEDAVVQEEEQQEAASTDTVEWVESGKTARDGSDGYAKIDKDSIPEPSYAMGNIQGVDVSYLAGASSRYPKPLRVVLRTTEESTGTTEEGGSTEGDGDTQSSRAEDSEAEGDDTAEADTGGGDAADGGATDEGGSSESGNATDGGKEEEQEQTVPTVEDVELRTQTLSLAVGETGQIEASARLSDGSKVSDGFSYKSDAERVATVDDAGKVTAHGAGTAMVTVSYKDSEGNHKDAVCTVSVEDVADTAVKSVTLDKSEVTVKVDTSVTLSATAKLGDDTEVTDGGKYTWTSDDKDIATVSDTGKVTGVRSGTTKVTATYKDANGNTQSATCTVKVVADPSKDTSSRLKDKDGNQVYVRRGDDYVEAVYADYYTAGDFYIVTETTYDYTGWQTIDGNTYYYDKNGSKVTGEQTIRGVTYHFNSEGILAVEQGAVLGIDVSKWNGSVNWSEVKNAGVKFVIIRCGYRGSATGVLVEDSLFKSNIQGARAAGLKVGVYFFTQAVSEVEAVEEASMVLQLVKGYGISYPIFIDTEYTTGRHGRADGLDRATRTAVCRAFCETIRSAGYTAGVYASRTWYTDNLNYSALSGYRIWLAQYAAQATFSSRYDLWQYSAKGSVSGIRGSVDMNWSYLGY